ncbi:hypothetical protein [Rubellicoccus peritrichatus]|uniref:Type II secretion system protein GspG C-terminal domain-containing protein n=1 Tax=Rubellicoccus peritrichatus TaxID=3080537 RepID=A0AAQ3LD87_9BACT|nr:hypothetical protein [Puniceicoccus sp. CR14]WOO43641.1 hypothetical protein RZN69_11125 [Puniceicoccus sp. CR14]
MWKKLAIGFGVLILVLSIVVVVGIFWLGRDADKELAAAKQRLIDMGAPMTIEELLPPPVPEDENAAPLYLELIAMEEENPAIAEAEEEIEALTEDYDWGEVFSLSLVEEQFDELEQILNREELAEYFALLEKITDRSYFQPDWDYNKGPSLLVPEVGTQMTATRLLLAKAVLDLRQNEEANAAKYAEQALQIANHANQSYILVSMLTAAAIRNSVFVFIESFDQASDNGLPLELIESWASNKMVDNWVNALDMERLGMGGTIFPAILDGDDRQRQSLFGEDEIGLSKISSNPGMRWFFVYDYAHYLNSMADSREFALLPYCGSIDDERRVSEASSMEAAEKYRIVSRIILMPTAMVRTNLVKADSKQLLTLTGLALSAYNKDHDKYPNSLGELVPDYLDEIPVDPLTGGGFVYRPEGEGYLLYGLGPNRVDDGGTTNEDGEADDEEGDLLWKGRGSVFGGL